MYSPINNYIKKVTKDMGIKQRNEVACELKTHILDSADAFAAENNVEVDDKIIRAVILRMGSAKEVADMYPVEMTLVDNVIDVLKFVARFTLIFILISVLIYIILWFYLKIELDISTVMIFFTIYCFLLVINMILRLEIFTKLFN